MFDNFFQLLVNFKGEGLGLLHPFSGILFEGVDLMAVCMETLQSEAKFYSFLRTKRVSI